MWAMKRDTVNRGISGMKEDLGDTGEQAALMWAFWETAPAQEHLSPWTYYLMSLPISTPKFLYVRDSTFTYTN